MPKENTFCQCSSCFATIRADNSHVRLEERYFCDTACVMEHIRQERKFEEACDPFHEPFRENITQPKMRYANTPFRIEDEEM